MSRVQPGEVAEEGHSSQTEPLKNGRKTRNSLMSMIRSTGHSSSLEQKSQGGRSVNEAGEVGRCQT